MPYFLQLYVEWPKLNCRLKYIHFYITFMQLYSHKNKGDRQLNKNRFENFNLKIFLNKFYKIILKFKFMCRLDNYSTIIEQINI